ncbi:MAG: TrbC/VirB2 family protein, partial [Gluconobacter oxydans]|uniref:TrbC/VirB2 family protein n=1 Tax=Gluconobacter oxydans TaxID=442 RepID=UPI0039EC7CCB
MMSRLRRHSIARSARSLPDSRVIGTAMLLSLCLGSSAWASGAGMPWEEPLNQILESVQGPVARIVSVI